MAETPNERFARLGTVRVNKALNMFRLLANLKKGGYKSTADQRDKMIIALRNGLDELEAVFAGEKLNKDKFVLTSIEEGPEE